MQKKFINSLFPSSVYLAKPELPNYQSEQKRGIALLLFTLFFVFIRKNRHGVAHKFR